MSSATCSVSRLARMRPTSVPIGCAPMRTVRPSMRSSVAMSSTPTAQPKVRKRGAHEARAVTSTGKVLRTASVKFSAWRGMWNPT